MGSDSIRMYRVIFCPVWKRPDAVHCSVQQQSWSGSLIKNMSKFLREKIEEEYLSITKTVFAKNPDRFPADVFTLPRFLWAYAVLLSRAFRLRVNGKDPHPEIPFTLWVVFHTYLFPIASTDYCWVGSTQGFLSQSTLTCF